MIVDEVARLARADSFRSKFSGEIARATIGDEEAWLLKPMTYMNLSGDSVQPCAAFYRIPPEQVLVVHDELDLPYGTIRLKKGGGHAGHNGLRSIIGRMGPEFCRLRFGVGRPPAQYSDSADYVLAGFNAEERETLEKHVATAAKTVLDIATRGFEAAMKSQNTRPKQPKSPPKEPPPETSGGAGGS